MGSGLLSELDSLAEVLEGHKYLRWALSFCQCRILGKLTSGVDPEEALVLSPSTPPVSGVAMSMRAVDTVEFQAAASPLSASGPM